MRVLRSSLFVAVTALVAAACGDKVNVTPPTPVTPTLHGIVVAPATSTISVGQTVQLTAAVSADAGVTATVTWTTTNSGVAGVTQTGLVNGAAAGTAGICASAAATGLTTVSNCAQVVVQPPTTVVPAVLQIASVTVAGNLNRPVPVPPNATGGQINVSVTVAPGTEKMDSVQVTLNGAPSGTQTFTSAQAAVMRSATDLSEQALITTLVFSINTAAFAPATGAVTYPNGAYTVGVIGFGHQGTTAAVNSATNTWPLLFFNADGWIIGQTLGTSTPGAYTNAAGYNYVGGPTTSVSVSAIPVLYSGAAISVTAPLLPTVQFGSGCGNGGTPRIQAMTAPVAPSKAFTAVYTRTNGAAAAANNVNNYEFSWSTCVGANQAGGETSFIVSSWYANNTIGPVGTIFGVANIRLDNQAPQGMGLTNTPNGRTNGWFNDAVVLNGTGANGVISTAPTDLGVGAWTYAATVGGVTMTSTSTLAESATPAAYTVSVTATDALGNTQAALTKTFGVDRTLPTLAALTQPKAPGNLGNVNPTFLADPAVGFVFVANDPPGTGGVASSGFYNLAGAPITMSEAARTSAGTTWWCPATTTYRTSASGCASWVSGTSFMSNLITTDNGTINAYFLTTASIADQAGNVSTGAFTTNLFEVDGAAGPTMGNLIPPGSFPTPNSSYTYSFPISVGTGPALLTGVDLSVARLALNYNAVPFDGVTAAGFAGGFSFWAPDVVIDGWNAATLQTSVTASVTVNNLLTNIEMTSATGANLATAGGAWPTGNTFGGSNQPNTTSLTGWSLLPAFPAFTAITNTGAAGFGPENWLICATATSSAPCGVTPAMPAAGSVTISRAAGTAVWITAVAEGQTGVFNNPFSAVQFWAYDPAGVAPGWRLIGTANNSSNVTDGVAAAPSGRNWQFNYAFTPNAAWAPDNGLYRVIAIGIGGTNLPAAQQGMALATPVGTVSIQVNP